MAGDAFYISKAIAELGVASAVRAFTGVDPSQPALDCAKANLQRLIPGDCTLKWIATDMQIFLEQSKDTYDFILASFSMHHLDTRESKLKVLREGKRLLAPHNGKLMMVDAIRWPNESVQGMHQSR